MNFYDQVSRELPKLSTTEQNVLNFIIKNLHRVKHMSIRELPKEELGSVPDKMGIAY